jgi:predicted outer membrane repeat protein
MILPLAALVTAPSASAATITVDTISDGVPGDGLCSLSEAIQAANTNAAVDACAAGSGADTIGFNTGLTGTITLAGTLSVTEALSINGPGAGTLTVSGGNAVRLLEVNAALDISGLTLTDGQAADVGGILNNDDLALTNVVVSDTTSTGFGNPAGAIVNYGTLTITDSTLSGNQASGGFGGAVGNYGTTTVTRSIFSGNSAPALSGGAIYNYYPDSSLTVTDSTFSANSAPYGGAIVNSVGMTITNTTFSTNSATFDGGAIYNYYASAYLTNTTFSGNSAVGEGGAIRTYAGWLDVTNSTFSGNSAAAGGALWSHPSFVVLKNTIMANSPAGGNCAAAFAQLPGDGGGNLSWPDSTCPGVNQDPLLDPAGLQDHGGWTKTIALQVGSPVIDAAVLANCPSGDQRGVERPQGAGCDGGAWEMPDGLAEVTVNPQATLRATGRVTARGNLICGPTGNTYRIYVRVDQASTGAITKVGQQAGVCSGDPDPWVVTPPKKPGSPAFALGAARVCWQARVYAGTTEIERVTFCNAVTLVAP